MATLKLTPLPEEKRLIRAIYSDVDAAAAVLRIMAQQVTSYALDFMDGRAIEMICSHSVPRCRTVRAQCR